MLKSDSKKEVTEAWIIGDGVHDGRYGKRLVCGRGLRETKMREKSHGNGHEGAQKTIGRWKSWPAYLLTASQIVLDGFQTGIGELDEEQSFVFARPLLGHKAIVLVRRQTVLHTSSQSGHRGESSWQQQFGSTSF